MKKVSKEMIRRVLRRIPESKTIVIREVLFINLITFFDIFYQSQKIAYKSVIW